MNGLRVGEATSIDITDLRVQADCELLSILGKGPSPLSSRCRARPASRAHRGARIAPPAWSAASRCVTCRTRRHADSPSTLRYNVARANVDRHASQAGTTVGR